MKLYLVRHAQSERNQGKEHDKLSETGIEQAKRLGLFLKNKHIDYIYCSEKERAKETLDFIFNYIKKVPTVYTKGINERDQGIFEGKSQKEYFFHEIELKSKGVDLLTHVPDGGESYLEVEKRAQTFLELIKNKHKFNDHILLVSHSAFLGMFVLRLMKLNIKEFQYFAIHNASLSTFELDEDFNVKDFEIDDFKHLLKYSSYERKKVERV